MNPSETARARSRAYALLAKLLLEGLDADTLARVRALPGWLLDEDDVGDLDSLAAEHHACFQLEVFPHAGVFRDRSAIAGASNDLVFEYYERAGFRPRLDAVTGDHLGMLLAFLAYACPHPRFDLVVAEFLDACVLSWLPALVVASPRLGEFWPRVLHAALELGAEHRLSLPHPHGDPRPLPNVDPLADDRTGLQEIAEHLLTPAASGLFLGRADILRLGRAQGLPCGFGSRLILLDNLLRGAVEHGRLAMVLESLDTLSSERSLALEQLAASLDLASAIEPWQAAIARTRILLRTLAAG